MKIPIRISSCIIALLCWLLFSGLSVFIFFGMQDRARLIRDNDNERTLNLLFTSLRDYDDFISAIEASPILRARILGLGIYRTDLSPLYAWGNAPSMFDENEVFEKDARNGRYTILNKKNRSIQFILKTERAGTPPPMPPRRENQGTGKMEGQSRHFFFTPLDNAKYLYIDIHHPDYWRTREIIWLLFPICEAALLFMVFYIRSLYLRNIEYRERIESQKNLVVVGTAASTLAHEIKNPLSSIRLQTGILRKLYSGNGGEEIGIIEEEVERLSALVYRVNDYLRDAAGFPVPLEIRGLLQDAARRLCGREILSGDTDGEYMVFMDVDRARSVFENIIRNALESGGPEVGISAAITRNNGRINIEILDRGNGIPGPDRKRIFDPFYTSKSAGTGIGLSISLRFTEAAGGTIGIEQRDGGGTVVRVSLPEYIRNNERINV